MNGEVYFWHADKHRSLLQVDTTFDAWNLPKVPKIRNFHSFAWGMKLISCPEINTNFFYKLIGLLWICAARHAQSTQNNKFTICLQYLKKKWNIKLTFCQQINVWKVSSNWYYHFKCVWPGMSKLTKITSLLFLCNILRKNWVMKLIFCMQINIKACCKLILWFWWNGQTFPKFP